MPKDLVVNQIVSEQRKLTQINITGHPLTRELAGEFVFETVTRYADGTVTNVQSSVVKVDAAQLGTVVTPELYALVSTFAHAQADAQEAANP